MGCLYDLYRLILYVILGLCFSTPGHFFHFFLKKSSLEFLFVAGIGYIYRVLIKTVNPMKKNHYQSKNRYPDGYMPKIEYYQAMLSNAVKDLNMEKVKFYTGKLDYFVERQNQLNSRLYSLYS
jgi:hypothetical protein